MIDDVDDVFFECIIEELRAGERVTVRTLLAPSRVLATLRRLGATDEELEQLEIVR